MELTATYIYRTLVHRAELAVLSMTSGRTIIGVFNPMNELVYGGSFAVYTREQNNNRIELGVLSLCERPIH